MQIIETIVNQHGMANRHTFNTMVALYSQIASGPVSSSLLPLVVGSFNNLTSVGCVLGDELRVPHNAIADTLSLLAHLDRSSLDSGLTHALVSDLLGTARSLSWWLAFVPADGEVPLDGSEGPCGDEQFELNCNSTSTLSSSDDALVITTWAFRPSRLTTTSFMTENIFIDIGYTGTEVAFPVENGCVLLTMTQLGTNFFAREPPYPVRARLLSAPFGHSPS